MGHGQAIASRKNQSQPGLASGNEKCVRGCDIGPNQENEAKKSLRTFPIVVITEPFRVAFSRSTFLLKFGACASVHRPAIISARRTTLTHVDDDASSVDALLLADEQTTVDHIDNYT